MGVGFCSKGGGGGRIQIKVLQRYMEAFHVAAVEKTKKKIWGKFVGPR